MFTCFEMGITAVSMVGGLVNARLIFDMKGTSGPVMILNRILPKKAISSPHRSIGAPIAVYTRTETPGGAGSMCPRVRDRNAAG